MATKKKAKKPAKKVGAQGRLTAAKLGKVVGGAGVGKKKCHPGICYCWPPIPTLLAGVQFA